METLNWSLKQTSPKGDSDFLSSLSYSSENLELDQENTATRKSSINDSSYSPLILSYPTTIHYRYLDPNSTME